MPVRKETQARRIILEVMGEVSLREEAEDEEEVVNTRVTYNSLTTRSSGMSKQMLGKR